MKLTGCIRDEHDGRDFVFMPETGALIGSSSDIDLTQYLPSVRDQIANDCCAHYLAGAAQATALVDGHEIPPPSVLYLYANSRQLANRELVDDGTNLRSMLKGASGKTIQDSRGQLSGLGMISEDRWPEVAPFVNVLPPDDCYRSGEGATVRSYTRILDGIGAIDGLIAALRRKRFPSVCFVVDQAFEDLGGGVYTGQSGAVLGGHAMLVCGYNETAHAFRIRNSWGTGWGDDGYGWVDQDFITKHAYDMWVVEVAPARLA